MATLREVIRLVAECAAETCAPAELARRIETAIRANYPGERVYIPPVDSQKDPARGDAIREAARTLPRGVVAARFGISRQLVDHHLNKRK